MYELIDILEEGFGLNVMEWREDTNLFSIMFFLWGLFSVCLFSSLRLTLEEFLPDWTFSADAGFLVKQLEGSPSLPLSLSNTPFSVLYYSIRSPIPADFPCFVFEDKKRNTLPIGFSLSFWKQFGFLCLFFFFFYFYFFLYKKYRNGDCSWVQSIWQRSSFFSRIYSSCVWYSYLCFFLLFLFFWGCQTYRKYIQTSFFSSFFVHEQRYVNHFDFVEIQLKILTILMHLLEWEVLRLWCILFSPLRVFSLSVFLLD